MGLIAEKLRCYCRAYCTNINSGPSLSNSSLKLIGQHKSVSGTIKDLSCVSLLSLQQVRLIQLGCEIILRYKIDKGAELELELYQRFTSNCNLLRHIGLHVYFLNLFPVPKVLAFNQAEKTTHPLSLVH